MKNILKEQQQQLQTGTSQPTTQVTATQPLQGTQYTESHGQAQHLGTTSYTTQSSYEGEVAREVHIAPTVLVEKVEKPVIVKETILPREKIEVQPVIHREREQLEVHEVVQPLHERDVAATSVRHATLPAEMRAEIRESDTAFQTSYREASTRHLSEVHTEAVQREVVNRPAIVEEHVHKRIVEEIQPVLYRETVTPVLIEETRPIYEKIVEAPRITEETRQMVDLGTRYTDVPTAQLGGLSLGEQPYYTGGQYQSHIPYSGQPLIKETTITRETFVEPARTTSHPHASHTETKRIV
jgi:hypothetical protein